MTLTIDSTNKRMVSIPSKKRNIRTKKDKKIPKTKDKNIHKHKMCLENIATIKREMLTFYLPKKKSKTKCVNSSLLYLIELAFKLIDVIRLMCKNLITITKQKQIIASSRLFSLSLPLSATIFRYANNYVDGSILDSLIL